MKNKFFYSSFTFFFTLNKNIYFEKFPKNKEKDKFLEKILTKIFSFYMKLKKKFFFFEISKKTLLPIEYIIERDVSRKISIKKEKNTNKKERRKFLSACLKEFLIKKIFKNFIERSETDQINPFYFVRFNVFGKNKIFIKGPLGRIDTKINCFKADYITGINTLLKNFYNKKKISKNFFNYKESFPAYFYFRYHKFFITFDSFNYIFNRIYHRLCINFTRNQIKIKYLNSFSRQNNSYDNSNITSYRKKKFLQTRVSFLGNFELVFKNKEKMKPFVSDTSIGVFLNSRLNNEYGRPFFNFYEKNLISKKKYFLWGERIFF